MTIPKRMDFRKSSKGGGEGILNKRYYIADFGPFFLGCFQKKIAIRFSENEGGGEGLGFLNCS